MGVGGGAGMGVGGGGKWVRAEGIELWEEGVEEKVVVEED